MQTRFLKREEFPHWAELATAAPAGGVYADPIYLEALCQATGGSFRILVAEHGGEITGGIALYEKPGNGRLISPRSLLYYNGITLVTHSTRTPGQETEWHLATLAALESALGQLPNARLRFKNRAPLSDLRVFAERGWLVEPQWTYVVDLCDMAASWSRVHKDQQRLIRRCRERGLCLTEDGDFDAFFDMHQQTHERKGAPLYLPREAFRLYVASLRERGLARLYHARLPDGGSAAAQLVLTGTHPVTHTVCAAAHPDHLSLGASAFLRWSVFEDLSSMGYRANDLTDAALNPVTRFKAQLGGDLQLCLEVSRPDSLRLRARNGAMTLAARLSRPLRRRWRAFRRIGTWREPDRVPPTAAPKGDGGNRDALVDLGP